LRVTVHRLRQRCRDPLRIQIADTVSGPENGEEVLRDLFRVLAS
jgi:hypothetical protein